MKIINELKDGALHVALHGNFTFQDNADFRGVLEQIAQVQIKKSFWI